MYMTLCLAKVKILLQCMVLLLGISGIIAKLFCGMSWEVPWGTLSCSLSSFLLYTFWNVNKTTGSTVILLDH
jgi:hypothetical protein